MTGQKTHPRLVRYRDLVPCTDAFIDTRTPGSDKKENFTIIGPGVSENPNQHVHIAEPHGFNIGGARQPAGCVNSQHSHDTAEVFYVHSGTWAFRLGERGEAAEIVLEAGDLISLPTQVFRGFENVGDKAGFLWAVLGGDDPGRVLWAPDVFDMASEYGLVLLENGRLVDLASGEALPTDVAPMPRTSADQIAALRIMSDDDIGPCCAKSEALSQRLLGIDGIIPHETGFTIDRMVLPKGDGVEGGRLDTADVVFLHDGHVRVWWEENAVDLKPGDTLTIPKNIKRSFLALTDATLIRVLGI